MEKLYINKYNSTDKSLGYNIAIGGQGGNLGAEVCKKISATLTGRKHSAETRKKLSEANKGKHLSETTKAKISYSNKGKVVSEETKQKMSESAKNIDRSNRCSHNKGLAAITDNVITKFIEKDDILPDGFRYGNCKTAGKHNMSKYYSSQDMQLRNKLSKAGANNNMFGKGYKVSGGNNGKAVIRYFYKGQTFECRKELLEYLSSQGINVSANAIRNIINRTYGIRIKNKFEDVILNLTWEYK